MRWDRLSIASPGTAKISCRKGQCGGPKKSLSSRRTSLTFSVWLRIGGSQGAADAWARSMGPAAPCATRGAEGLVLERNADPVCRAPDNDGLDRHRGGRGIDRPAQKQIHRRAMLREGGLGVDTA